MENFSEWSSTKITIVIIIVVVLIIIIGIIVKNCSGTNNGGCCDSDFINKMKGWSGSGPKENGGNNNTNKANGTT